MATHSPQPDRDAEGFQLRYRAEIPADINRIAEVLDGVMKAVDEARCAVGQEGEIALAVQEALANAVVHGAGGDGNKRIWCSVGYHEQRGLLIVVSDPGQGFDLSLVPDPKAEENIVSDHGRGIFLINRLMDQVEFRRGGAEIRMKKFPASPA